MYQLSAASHVVRIVQVLDVEESELKELLLARPSDRMIVNVFGPKPVPRFTALFGKATYSFSGQTLEPREDMPRLVTRCLDYATMTYPEFKWTGSLVNWYMTGADCIGKHSDDEADLVDGAPILSFSFGATRIFRVKAKPGIDVFIPQQDFPTTHNSLLVMGGAMQREFTHEVPRSKKVHDWRINVTIRAFK